MPYYQDKLGTIDDSGLADSLLRFIKSRIFPSQGSDLHLGLEQSPDMNPRRFIDKTDPNYQPSIYAKPKPNFVYGQSGDWRTPIKQFVVYVIKNPRANIDEIIKGTGLSEYQVWTISKLLKMQSKKAVESVSKKIGP